MHTAFEGLTQRALLNNLFYEKFELLTVGVIRRRGRAINAGAVAIRRRRINAGAVVGCWLYE